jgi:hypothetical protein
LDGHPPYLEDVFICEIMKVQVRPAQNKLPKGFPPGEALHMIAGLRDSVLVFSVRDTPEEEVIY